MRLSTDPVGGGAQLFRLTHRKRSRAQGVATVWHVEESVETTATPEAIWRCWTDVNGWPRWVPDFQWSRLVGPFEEGGTIENKARGLPVAKVRIATVRPLSFFRTKSRLLGMHLVFDHGSTRHRQEHESRRA